MTRRSAHALNPRERVYILDAARGYTVVETARRHNVTVDAVKSAIKTAKAALGTRTIAHTVALAIMHGEFTGTDIREGTKSCF